MNKRKKRNYLDEMRKLAAEHGGECLSDSCPCTRAKIKMRCGKGHEWSAFYNNIKRGSWCQRCANTTHSLEEAQKIAKSHGGRCLSEEYISTDIKLTWECDKGHIWRALLPDIKNGTWCRNCSMAKLRRHTIEEMKNLARKNGGECLSNKYVRCDRCLRWRCKNGHEWDSAPKNILNERWCPLCINKSQEKLVGIISKLLNFASIHTEYSKFNWLVNEDTGGRQRIDIFIIGNKKTLAIEYDGQGHFYPVKFKGCGEDEAKRQFKRTKVLDELKNKKIAAHRDDVSYFIRFSYKDILDEENVKKKLIKNNIPLEL